MTTPAIINSERQDFDGRKYWRDGRYFKHKGTRTRLHRVVWSNFWGPIPKGSHIHHIDGDTTNNRLENLSCLSPAEHLRQHADALRYPVQIVCAHCGASCMVAATNASRARYCSKYCGVTHWRKRRRAVKIP